MIDYGFDNIHFKERTIRNPRRIQKSRAVNLNFLKIRNSENQKEKNFGFRIIQNSYISVDFITVDYSIFHTHSRFSDARPHPSLLPHPSLNVAYPSVGP